MSIKKSRRKQNRGKRRAALVIFACLCILAVGLCAWGMGMQAGLGDGGYKIGQDSDRKKKAEDSRDRAKEDNLDDDREGNQDKAKKKADSKESDSKGSGSNEGSADGSSWEEGKVSDSPDTDEKTGNRLGEGNSDPLSGETSENLTADSVSSNGKDKDPFVLVSQMSLEDKVAQLFVITPEQLTGVGQVIRAGEATKEALRKYPVGGLIYFSNNLQSPDQLKEMTQNTQRFAEELGIFPLFLAIDEEGGDVARIGNNAAFSVPSIPPMASIGASGDVRKAYEAGDTIGEYLSRLGINLDFAPDADVLTNPANTVVKTRSFGANPDLVTQMAIAYLKGLNSHGVYGAPKHFPGHGATAEDSHKGFAYVNKTWEELEKAELVPFTHFAEQKVNFIMSGHISLPAITGTDIPCSLSKDVLEGYLREKMGYQGIIITDALNMGAIQNHYSSGEAAVTALEAGVDMLLMPANFQEAYLAVLDAVRQGRISEERIDQSVTRIVQRKVEMVR